MMKIPEYHVYKFDEKYGNREELVQDSPIKEFSREKCEYDKLLDDDLVDVVYHNNDTYRLFWNKELLKTKKDLRKITEQEQILGVIYINNYKQPMVVKSEPISDKKAGFVGYRHDGKAIIAGEATLYEDHIEVHSSPVYGRVKFGCLCGGEKRLKRPPKAGPEQ
ncbi:hypothetical protein KA005_44125 [bacterium]|nr:hypothetical protein [bacterium]